MLKECFERLNEIYPPPPGKNNCIIYGSYSELLKLGLWRGENMLTFIFDEDELNNVDKLMLDIADYIVAYDNCSA